MAKKYVNRAEADNRAEQVAHLLMELVREIGWDNINYEVLGELKLTIAERLGFGVEEFSIHLDGGRYDYNKGEFVDPVVIGDACVIENGAFDPCFSRVTLSYDGEYTPE